MAETTKAPEEQTPPSTGHKSIHEAFIAVLGELEPLIKDEKGNYREYATLSAVTKVIRPVLKNHNLGYFTYFEGINQPEPTLVNRLFNAAGESIEQYYPVICVQRNDPQKFGGAITYARRYSTMAFFGMAPEDDDGEAASEKSRTASGGGHSYHAPAVSTGKTSSHPDGKTAIRPAASPFDQGAERRLDCEVPACKNTITASKEQKNRDMHKGHVICQFHSTNGDWETSLGTAAPAQPSQTVDQSTFDEQEAAFLDSIQPDVMVNPDGSTAPVEEAA